VSIDFDDIVAFTIGREKGLVDDPKDPGGRTKYGITQRRLNAERVKRPDWNLPARVDDLNPLQVKMIYLHGEWEDIRGDELPGQLALLLFEHAVNAGSKIAIELLQQALSVPVDGSMGPITSTAARRAPLLSLCEEYAARRGYYYATLDKLDDRFGLGWMRRLLRAYTLSLESEGA
jgi:lysozyme family protein